MSFIFCISKICKIKVKFKCFNQLFFTDKTNFKKYTYKNLPYFISVRHFSVTETTSFSFTSLKNSLLCISVNAVHMLRRERYLSRQQKYILKPVNNSKQKALYHKFLVNSLQMCKSVEEQIQVFHSIVKLPEEDISSRHSICQDLEKILKPYYSSCSVQLLGSSINGIGLKGCDVDLSLQYTDRNITKNLFDENASLHEDVRKENYASNKLYNFPSKNQLLSIRKILQDLKYEEPLTVIPGRCPILNFYYQNLSCDLAINNSSALHGTNLMLLCSKLDERVLKLVQIINYWAKHSHLIGGPVKFKSYALFLLVIYFLQTRNPTVLPTVETMFEKTDFLKNLQNWTYDVGKYMNKFERSKNTQTVEELLREFFFFYGNFDFSYIICPISGTSIDRNIFAEKYDCENSFELNTICIQDPLDCTWNVTTEVNWKHCKNFLKAMISVCEKYLDQHFRIPQPCNWGLASLIDSEFSYDNLKEIKEFSMNIPLASRTCEEFSVNNVKNELAKTASNVKEILTHCLLFQCYQVDCNTNFSSLGVPDNVRTMVLSEFLNNPNVTDEKFKKSICSDFISYYVCSTNNTWFGRNTFSSLYNVENVLENEHMISKRMNLQRGSSERETFYFSCHCFGICLEEDIFLHIKLKPLNNNRFMPKLVIFLKEYIPLIMCKYLLHSPIIRKDIN